MFDFGISSGELLLIAIVALIVVGPKDLPQLLRMIGRMMTKMRGMAREFQSHIDEAMRDTGVDDVKKEVAKMTDFSTTAPDLKKEADDLKKAIESSAPTAAANGAVTNGAASPEAKEATPAPAIEEKATDVPAPVADQAEAQPPALIPPAPETKAVEKTVETAGS
ncbi:MAG: Sec-independent protein translocase protein TatB [Parvibaculaceae bacterium]